MIKNVFVAYEEVLSDNKRITDIIFSPNNTGKEGASNSSIKTINLKVLNI